jgi:hypothetical protein
MKEAAKKIIKASLVAPAMTGLYNWEEIVIGDSSAGGRPEPEKTNKSICGYANKGKKPFTRVILKQKK